MRVLAFGTYHRDYPRNAQVRSCLRAAGVEVVEAPRAGLGRAAGRLVGRPRERSPGSPWRRAVSRCERRPTRGRRPRRLPGPLRRSGSPACRRGPSRRVRPARLARSTRSSSDRRRFGATSAGRTGTAPRSTGSRSGRPTTSSPTRRAQADFYVDRFGLERDRVGVCLVGAEDRLFFPSRPNRRAVPRSLRREADPTARARRRSSPPRGSLPRSRFASSAAASSRPGSRTPRQMSTHTPWVELREAAFDASQRRVRARDLRDVRESVGASFRTRPTRRSRAAVRS